MSNPAQVRILPENVYCYVHLNGHKVYEHVANALQKATDNNRLDHTDYLTRIIIDELPTTSNTTGLGVSGKPYNDIYRDVVLHDTGTISIVNIYDDDHIGDYTIPDFINKYATNQE